MRRRFWAPASLVWQLMAGAACGKESAAVEKKPLKVLIQEVQVGDVPVYWEFVGTVDGFQNAEIRARTPGYVEKIHYQEGHAVKTGDLLFTIDPILARASVTSASGSVQDAKAGLAKAKADVARLTPLAKARAVSQQELDDAVASEAAANARITVSSGELNSAQATLSYTKVTSPIDGIAGLANVRVGNLVGQFESTLLTTVSTLDPVRVRFALSEQQYLKLADKFAEATQQSAEEASARPATLELVLSNGKIYPHKGRLAVVERQIDLSTGTLAIEALFPNPGLMLRPGQFAKVRGSAETKHGVVLVPQRAVRELQSGYQVGVVGPGNKVEIRSVVATDTVGSNWIIEEGLEAGDKVIVEGLLKSRPGDVVAPEVRAAAPTPQPGTPAGEAR